MSKRFTDADYAEMAEDAEGDATNPPTAAEVVDVEVSPAVLRMGRPTKGAGGGRTPVISVRLPKAIRTELNRRADAQGASPSELIRQAVVEFFGNHPPPA